KIIITLSLTGGKMIVTVCSTKGGVGRTTLTANLGGFLADAGYRVLLVDADIQPTLSSYYRKRSTTPILPVTARSHQAVLCSYQRADQDDREGAVLVGTPGGDFR